MLAKQRYFNSLAAGSLSNYDEKVLGEMTAVRPADAEGQPAKPAHAARADSPTQTSNLSNLQYTPNAIPGRGTYYTMTGQSDFELRRRARSSRSK